MNYLEFNRNCAQHDLFDAPYIDRRGFVRFASGEVIFTNPKPTDRRTDKDLGIQIVATGDDDCPDLYVEPTGGKPIPKARLNQGGMQWLAIDHECGVAVRLAPGGYRYGRVGAKYQLRDVDHFAPHYLTGRFTAYWAGPARRPIGDPITVSEPYRATKEQKQHLADLKDQANAWAAMTDLPQYAYVGNQGVPNQHPAHYYFDKQFTDLSDLMKKSLHYYGWSNFRVKTEHPYLYVRKA
jgi:hypothetical protein